MDWTLAIDRNRDALLRMLALLFVTAGLDRGGVADMLPRRLHRLVLRVLRSAEAAARRLVVIVKQVEGIEARVPMARAARPLMAAIPQGTGERAPSFALFDPRKSFAPHKGRRFARREPFIWSPGMDNPVFVAQSEPSPDDLVSVEQVGRRLSALKAALEDLPKQARKLARWEAKREVGRAQTGKFMRAMRPGTPPGHRVKHTHPVDMILSDCHALALYALHAPPEP